MSSKRVECLKDLERDSECKVVLVTKKTLSDYILPENPLHPAYEYLSETHKADYLRTYFMNFHGGGYSDIKRTSGSWKHAFDSMESSDSWICGYKEIEGGVAYGPHVDKWRELVGNGSYICKPLTPLTMEWYSEMLSLLDTKLEKLRLHPSSFPQDCAEVSSYPIEWNELLGRIFHKVCYAYRDKISNTLPMCVCRDYR
jgi:hypothetical protein